ncbi:MAG: saccharopine dehydrogenase NADP-binding domain-containing protein [Flavobacteriaceae bacterium]
MTNDKSDNTKILLYGANGYTGQLITKYAMESGLTPILAGRNKEAIKSLAEANDLEYSIFNLGDRDAAEKALEGIDLVLHAAGPFMYTAKPMIKACLKNGAHYLDITGEIAVFEMANRFDDRARQKELVIMPGVGFDVVPTDCMAVYLKQKLPDATRLKLGFGSVGGGISRGTAMTMIEGLGAGSAERVDGRIVRVPMAQKTIRVDVDGKTYQMMSIPWGDVSTAYHSTGIPNIETYTAVSASALRMARLQNYFGGVMRSGVVKRFLRKKVEKRPAGPSDARRDRARSFVYGEATNAKGEKAAAILHSPEGYTLTAMTSVMIVQAVLNGKVESGFQTPAKALGADFILKVEGTKRVDL